MISYFDNKKNFIGSDVDVAQGVVDLAKDQQAVDDHALGRPFPSKNDSSKFVLFTKKRLYMGLKKNNFY